MSEYQYYGFLAVDRPLTAAEQAEVRRLSTRARITATSFTNEYHWGNFRGDPRQMMRRYYDAHLYLANWGSRQIMLRLPRALLSPKVAGRYSVEGHVDVMTTPGSVILDLTSEDDSGEWEEGAEDSLPAIAGVRPELAAGNLRGLYLAWLSAYGAWERDEGAFGDDDEEVREPPVPAGVGSLTAPQRALADFLRLDPDLLAAAAQGRAARNCPRRRRIRARWPPTSPGSLRILAASDARQADNARRAAAAPPPGFRPEPESGAARPSPCSPPTRHNTSPSHHPAQPASLTGPATRAAARAQTASSQNHKIKPGPRQLPRPASTTTAECQCHM